MEIVLGCFASLFIDFFKVPLKILIIQEKSMIFRIIVIHPEGIRLFLEAGDQAG